MSLTRRTFVNSAAISAFAGGLAHGVLPGAPLRAWAKSSIMLGQTQVDVLSDGSLRLPVKMLMAGVPQDELLAYFGKHQLSMDMLEPSCNLTLVRDGERVILFDVGSGQNFVPTAGKITEALDAIGLEPSQITHVVFTHAHPDHLWGLLDDFDDPLFSEAEYLISKPEWDYWTNPDTVNTIGEERQSFAVGARRNLLAIEENISRFNFETEILPGIRAIDTAGHTPGHTSFEVRSGTQSVVVVGDILTNPLYSFEKPFWPSGSDQDRDMGISARKRLLDELSGDKMQLIGYHIPYPGIGWAERSGDAYRFVAA